MSTQPSLTGDFATAPSDALRDAQRQVRRLRRFYRHLVLFSVVGAGLLVLNLVVAPARTWIIWPMLGWSVWLVLHGLTCFAGGRWFGRAWEQRKLAELMAEKG